ncbi:hypothetical protein K1719_019865 [Acacia pycnantha]|nr:hypothetical protein K1719_019865 [Acacia pycnantha]
MMSYSRRSRYSRSPSPYKRHGRSVSRSPYRSRSRSFSRSPSREVENPGNNLYVTGLSARITKRDHLEKHFASEGKVIDVRLVVDPWTRESRGFGFVTMKTVEEADRCVKHLNRSVLEGRVIKVEKARRRRGRTPTPGRYLGSRDTRGRHRSVSSSPRRSPSYSPYRRSYSRSPYSDRSRSRSYSPYHSRRRSYIPDYSRRRSYDDRRRSYSPYSRSPVSRRDRSYSPYDSPDDRYYRRHRYRSISRSVSPRRRRRSRRYSRSVSPVKRRSSRRSYSRSPSPRPRRSSGRRSYSRSLSPRPKRSSRRRSYSRSLSPRPRRSSRRRSYSRSISPRPRGSMRGGSSKRGHTPVSDRSYSRSRSVGATTRSASRSLTP